MTSNIATEFAVITGTDFSGEITGIPILTDNGINLQDSQKWSLYFSDIEKVDITKVGRLYVLIEAVGSRRYELGFSENSEFGESIYEDLKKIMNLRIQTPNDSV
jgi:hypothetical protein